MEKLVCVSEEIRKLMEREDRRDVDHLNGQILVTKFAYPDISNYLMKAAGVVTDNGGTTSHAANMAREYNLPCVVGTGNATVRIAHGRRIRIEADKEGLVYLL